MSAIEGICERLRSGPMVWTVTGAAGFIGSHLVEQLLRLGQTVRGFDNFSTGKRENLEELGRTLPAEMWARFTFIEGDLRDPDACRQACEGSQRVLHQGALGSVPRSVANPVASHENNVNGTLNLFVAARDAGIRRVVYASSSSVYGDNTRRPAAEGDIGRVLSPYAATKRINEIYAGVFALTYGMEPVGLRYHNVFGPRQDPEGAYAAVIPRWISDMLHGREVSINGDGETSRDFCHVSNVVQANLLAAMTERPEAVDQVFNVALQVRTTLNELFGKLRSLLLERGAVAEIAPAVHRDFRAGDIRHSLADISKIRGLLGYEPTHDLDRGLAESIDWYCRRLR